MSTSDASRPSDLSCQQRARKSRFIEIFRTTPPKTVCPNFFVLSHANGCAFMPRCRYCYLKSSFWYLSAPLAFSNVDQMVREVEAWIARDELETYILNSGNLSDSLAFEQTRPAMARLVEVFRQKAEAAGRPHSLLLVTKRGLHECRTLLETAPCRNVIVSFSINNDQAAKDHEPGAPPSAERLDAARRLRERGWRLRLRMDPMIEGYDYVETARQVKAARPERVTLGTLRAEAGLLRLGEDGLFDELEKPTEERAMARYPLGRRLALYRQATGVLLPEVPVALCEETLDVWLALGLNPDARACNCGI